MRYLVLSDLHSNLEALEAVLAMARTPGYERTLVLGDIVGYGADPNPVVEGIRTNVPLHRRIMNDPEFIRGNLHTGFLDRLLERKVEAAVAS